MKREHRVRPRALRAARGGAGSKQRPPILLRASPDDALAFAPPVPDLQEAAMRWSYVLRNRPRWARQGATLDHQARAAREQLGALGVQDDILAEIARTGFVEVDVLYEQEHLGWERRVFPWEYMLAAATRERRLGRGLTVVRRLRRTGSAASAAPRELSVLLHVESAPGELRDRAALEAQRPLLGTHLGATGAKSEQIVDPLLQDLAGAVRRLDPAVVHLAGFDSHEAAQLLGPDKLADDLDGLVVRDSGGGYAILDAAALARALAAGTGKPLLVGCNLHHSAARIAALAVAEGAEAAIGFQDSFDHTLAELFFANFYRAWRLSGWNTVEAFRFAWDTIRERGGPQQGTGVVLWSARSAFELPRPSRERLPYRAVPRRAAARSAGEIRDRVLEEAAKFAALTPETAAGHLEVQVRPVERINYSVLHNGGALFERFEIRKKDYTGRIDDVHVRVELHVGTDTYPFRATLALDEREDVEDLRRSVRVSLASSLLRSLRESIQSNLFVEVLWRDTVLYRQTHPVTLLPVDEWRDEDPDRAWLPSFVLPRDPAVPRIIDAAQRYLMALADDPSAGFDGYQSVDEKLKNPADACAGVDVQVQAIWCALLYEFPLHYINPPPTFTASSQRLRTPSDVVQGRRGTCIDLSLLLAACLEYVEIYPAIILLEDHAFPAYWRSDSYHERFATLREAGRALAATRPAPGGPLPPAQEFSWYLVRSQYREVLLEVLDGRLVPIETTWVTGHSGFWEAVDEGAKNLSRRGRFDAMIDVVPARTDRRTPVTPLPLLPAEP